jgi:hypothetical protein
MAFLLPGLSKSGKVLLILTDSHVLVTMPVVLILLHPISTLGPTMPITIKTLS